MKNNYKTYKLGGLTCQRRTMTASVRSQTKAARMKAKVLAKAAAWVAQEAAVVQADAAERICLGNLLTIAARHAECDLLTDDECMRLEENDDELPCLEDNDATEYNFPTLEDNDGDDGDISDCPTLEDNESSDVEGPMLKENNRVDARPLASSLTLLFGLPANPAALPVNPMAQPEALTLSSLRLPANNRSPKRRSSKARGVVCRHSPAQSHLAGDSAHTPVA